jgi:hypothetical protein
MLCDISNWLASGAALVSAITAYLTYKNAEKSRKHLTAVTLLPHFTNIKDLLYFKKNKTGFSQDIINRKKESISALRNYIYHDKELNKILDNIDSNSNCQNEINKEEKDLDETMKKYLGIFK